MKKNSIALFANLAEAEATVQELTKNGIALEEISIIANKQAQRPKLGLAQETGAEGEAAQEMPAGAIARFAPSVEVLVLPDLGPVLAAGPMTAELSGDTAGAGTGGVLGWLVRRGISEMEAGCYCEAILRGGVLLSVDVPEDRAAKVGEIIAKHRTVSIEDCERVWREQGWTGFQPQGAVSAAGGARAFAFDPARMHSGKDRQTREPQKFRVS